MGDGVGVGGRGWAEKWLFLYHFKNLPVSFKSLKVTLAPHRCTVQRWRGWWCGDDTGPWAIHRVKSRPPQLIGPGSRPSTGFCPQPWQGGPGLPLLTLPEVVTTEYLLLLICTGQSLYK